KILALAVAPLLFCGTIGRHADVPATTPAGGRQVEHLTVTVIDVEGKVAYRNNEADEWKPVKVGQVLNEMAEFRTGIRSAVQFSLPPDQIITLDRLGTV